MDAYGFLWLSLDCLTSVVLENKIRMAPFKRSSKIGLKPSLIEEPKGSKFVCLLNPRVLFPCLSFSLHQCLNEKKKNK